MTTSKVTQIGLYPAATQPAGQASGAQTDDFSRIFASQSSQTENKTQTVKETSQAVDHSTKETTTKEADTKEDTSVKDSARTEKTDQSKETKDVKETDQAEEATETKDEEKDTEAVMEAITQIMATIADVLNVKPEQIQSAMEELGMSPQDLLDAEMIPQLVVALTEGADELSVMTDAELFADVQKITTEVNGILEELSKQLDITPDQLKEMLQNMPKEEAVTEDIIKTPQTDSLSDLPKTEESRVQVPVEQVTASSAKREQGRDSDMTGSKEHQMTFAQTVTEQIEQAVAKTETNYSSYTRTQDIMNQIQDMIKVIRTQDLTEMELQLHPASLGHVKVQVAMTEGVLTATFTTENEAVKAALESQMLVLKENFEQQGIKVEAVEVTVASHAFEENLSNSENAAKEEPEPEKKKSVRKISLSELLTEDTEELSEEDRIVAEMMKQNGNTVDYTV